jgi:hypothetical protein
MPPPHPPTDTHTHSPPLTGEVCHAVAQAVEDGLALAADAVALQVARLRLRLGRLDTCQLVRLGALVRALPAGGNTVRGVGVGWEERRFNQSQGSEAGQGPVKQGGNRYS